MGLIDSINVGGVEYSIQGRSPVGSCPTPAGTDVKVCSFTEEVTVHSGVLFSVKFTYANTYGDGSTTYPHVRINGTDYALRTVDGAYAASGAWSNNQSLLLMFDGTDFIILSTAPMDTVPTSGSKRACESGGIYTALSGKIDTTARGASNGVASLDANGRVPYTQLPESAMEFKGEWNASTNTPQLTDGTGTNGDFYICNVAGTVTFGTGNTVTFAVNDRALYNGSTSKWTKLPAGEVTSVNGHTGAVTLSASDVGAATSTDITNAINALDVSSVGGAGKYIQSISEANGKISATSQTMDTAPTASSTKACTSGGIKTYVDGKVVSVETISDSVTKNCTQDKRFIVTANKTLTLGTSSTANVVAEVFAVSACTVSYAGTSLSMPAGTCAKFIFYSSSWRYYGLLGAVWN